MHVSTNGPFAVWTHFFNEIYVATLLLFALRLSFFFFLYTTQKCINYEINYWDEKKLWMLFCHHCCQLIFIYVWQTASLKKSQHLIMHQHAKKKIIQTLHIKWKYGSNKFTFSFCSLLKDTLIVLLYHFKKKIFFLLVVTFSWLLSSTLWAFSFLDRAQTSINKKNFLLHVKI